MSSDLSGIVGKLEGLVNRLESVAIRAESGGRGGDEGDSANVQAFEDQIIGGKLKDYFRLSTEIGGDVKEHSVLLKEAFATLKSILSESEKFKLPSQSELAKFLQPLSKSVDNVQSYADKKRNSQFDNHLRTVKEAVAAVGWVSAPKPGTYIKETKDQCMFYGNRVIKDYKGKDEKHVEWCRALIGSLTELEQFVKDCYVIGLSWNSQGAVWTESSRGAAPPTAGAPPPPPPPAVQPPSATPSNKGDNDQANRANLFASINQGTDITKGLKKVTKDMQTHKNPNLRAGGVVHDKAAPAAKTAPAPAAKKTGPPRCELEGKKWVVEYQSNNPSVTLTGEQKQTVYIYKCDNSTITINGKLNSIVLDSCQKVGVVVNDVISTLDFVNCQRVKAQVLGKVPCVNIDKTDGIEVYLSKESVNSEIVCAKSSSMNILIPKNDDFVEYPLPEQFKSQWNGSTFVTSATEST